MARALYDWTKIDDNDQMSLIKGQQVIVTAVEDPNWWYGKMQDNSSQGYILFHNYLIVIFRPPYYLSSPITCKQI